MQNNVTELTQRLLQSLDSNYNVINMPEVNEILSLLEKVAITKELLEATRLGKHVNELRRKTTNENLSRRAKELVKRWRSIFLPESNGQLKQGGVQQEPEESLQQSKSKKRLAKDNLDTVAVKRGRINGQISELDFSDNSNSSFKDVINYNFKNEVKRDVIVVNSDSNSSFPESRQETPQVEQHLPKKRGRKKGSTNHRKLIDEAETSFCNKLAVSRGNSKVKTTQELIASLQNKNANPLWSPCVKKEDLNERAAKLTERVSIIDQKLNTNLHRYKNSQRKGALHRQNERQERVIESGSVINDKSLIQSASSHQSSSAADDEIIIVDDVEAHVKQDQEESVKTEEEENQPDTNKVKSLSVEEALSQLPQIKTHRLEDDEDEEEEEQQPHCTCVVKVSSDFSVGEESENCSEDRYETVEDPDCAAKCHLENKYHPSCVCEDKANYLHTNNIPNVNGNYSKGLPKRGPELDENGLFVSIVPNVNSETLQKKFSAENYKKYCISDSESGHCFENGRTATAEADISDTFREWHEVVETPSYNGEIFKILPYVIID